MSKVQNRIGFSRFVTGNWKLEIGKTRLLNSETAYGFVKTTNQEHETIIMYLHLLLDKATIV